MTVPRALAIFAHPDDAELSCFGSLAAFAHVGVEPHIVALTDGSNSTSSESLRRPAEAKEAAEILGAEIIIEGFTDGALGLSHDVYDCVLSHVCRLAPAIVFTHFPCTEDHQDHETAGRVATTIAMRSESVHLVLQGEPPVATSRFIPTAYIDVTPHLKTKLRAVHLYKSEREKPYMSTHAIIDRARWWARQADSHAVASERYYEAFHIAKARLTTDLIRLLKSVGSTP